MSVPSTSSRLRSTRRTAHGVGLVRAESGAVLVEFALAMPLLALLMVAIIDFSLAMFTLNNLTTAVREGARRAATASTTPVNNDTAVTNLVRRQIALSFANRGAPAPTVTSEYNATTGIIRVTVQNYRYVPVTPLVQQLTLARRAEFRWERSEALP
jgi:Flp pilus assembly protein TadG